MTYFWVISIEYDLFLGYQRRTRIIFFCVRSVPPRGEGRGREGLTEVMLFAIIDHAHVYIAPLYTRVTYACTHTSLERKYKARLPPPACKSRNCMS